MRDSIPVHKITNPLFNHMFSEENVEVGTFRNKKKKRASTLKRGENSVQGGKRYIWWQLKGCSLSIVRGREKDRGGGAGGEEEGMMMGN